MADPVPQTLSATAVAPTVSAARPSTKRPRRNEAALEALARKREAAITTFARLRELVLAKLRAIGWTGVDAPASACALGGGVLATTDLYDVTFHHDLLSITHSILSCGDTAFDNYDVRTGIREDVEFVRSYFEGLDEELPEPTTLGPWMLRIEYNLSLLRGKLFMYNHRRSGGSEDVRFARVSGDSVMDEMANMVLIFSDDNAEKLVVQLRFTPAQEPVLDALLREMNATGRIRVVDEFLCRNGCV